MAFSYSFHISSKSHSVSTVGKASQVSKHNLRTYKSQKYDKEQISVLVGSSTNLVDDIREMYHREFDEALQRYNSTKRSDRQIKDYLDHVSKSRSDIAVEIIIQIGDKDFWKDKSLSDRKVMDYIFKDQIRGLESLCPEFKVCSAVAHYDESSPHLHVVGVPVARGYEKGMEVQCAKTKVFTQESLTKLQDKMRQRAEIGIALNPKVFGGVQLKEKAKGRNKDIPKQALADYYELEQEISSLSVKKDDVTDYIRMQEETLERQAEQIKEQRSVLETIKMTAANLMKKISDLKAEYQRLLAKPPKEVIIEKVVEVPKEVIVEVPKEVIVEKVVEKVVEVPKLVETNVDYKDAFERSLNAFYEVVEWSDSKYKSMNAMCDELVDKSEDFARTFKTAYPRCPWRVMPLAPEGQIKGKQR